MFHEWSSEAQPDGFADRIEVMTGVDPHKQVAMVEREEADIALDYSRRSHRGDSSGVPRIS